MQLIFNMDMEFIDSFEPSFDDDDDELPLEPYGVTELGAKPTMDLTSFEEAEGNIDKEMSGDEESSDDYEEVAVKRNDLKKDKKVQEEAAVEDKCVPAPDQIISNEEILRLRNEAKRQAKILRKLLYRQKEQQKLEEFPASEMKVFGNELPTSSLPYLSGAGIFPAPTTPVISGLRPAPAKRALTSPIPARLDPPTPVADTVRRGGQKIDSANPSRWDERPNKLIVLVTSDKRAAPAPLGLTSTGLHPPSPVAYTGRRGGQNIDSPNPSRWDERPKNPVAQVTSGTRAAPAPLGLTSTGLHPPTPVAYTGRRGGQNIDTPNPSRWNERPENPVAQVTPGKRKRAAPAPLGPSTTRLRPSTQVAYSVRKGGQHIDTANPLRRDERHTLPMGIQETMKSMHSVAMSPDRGIPLRKSPPRSHPSTPSVSQMHSRGFSHTDSPNLGVENYKPSDCPWRKDNLSPPASKRCAVASKLSSFVTTKSHNQNSPIMVNMGPPVRSVTDNFQAYKNPMMEPKMVPPISQEEYLTHRNAMVAVPESEVPSINCVSEQSLQPVRRKSSSSMPRKNDSLDCKAPVKRAKEWKVIIRPRDHSMIVAEGFERMQDHLIFSIMEALISLDGKSIPTAPLLQFKLGKLEQNNFILICKNRETRDWVLKWRPPEYLKLEVVIPSEQLMKIGLFIKSSERIDLNIFKQMLKGQNRDLLIDTWGLYSVEHHPGGSQFIFLVDSEVLEKLEEVDWEIHYLLNTFKAVILEEDGESSVP